MSSNTTLSRHHTLPVNLKSIYDLAFFALIMMVWAKDVLLTYVKAVIMRLPLIGAYSQVIMAVIWSIVILFALPQIIKRLRVNNILFVLIVASVYLVNYVIFPDNKDALDEMFNGFMFSLLPMYLIGATIDAKRYFPYMYILSAATVIGMTLYKTVISEPMTDIASLYQGDMNSAYKLLPHACLVAYKAVIEPKFSNITIFSVGFIFMFSLGCRGALGCLILFFIIMLIWFKKYKQRVLSYTVIIASAGAVIVFFYDIVELLSNLSAKLGLSVRIFDKVTSGEIFVSSGRDKLLKKITDAILESPAIGKGIGADRTIADSYVHNIIYEFWLDFGIPIGSVLLLLTIMYMLRAYLAAATVHEKVLLITLVFSGFVQLFMSSSYLISPSFFLLLGLCSRYIFEKKLKNKVSCITYR